MKDREGVCSTSGKKVNWYRLVLVIILIAVIAVLMPIDDSVIVAPAVAAMTDGTIITRDDSVKGSIVPVMFEDESLEKIVREIAEAYGVEVRFDNIDAASLHLYYKFNPLLPLDEIVEQLNTFEQINIARQDNLLIVD